MEYKRLGSSGLKVSVIGLGGTNFGRYTDLGQTERIIHAAIECGVNFIDTSDAYGNGRSEEHIGAALRDRRHQMLVATKVGKLGGPDANDLGNSRKNILNSVEGSLRRLGTDYIDLYQLHEWDDEAPLDETLRTLDDLVRAGKVRYVGCSNFTAWQVLSALWIADRRGYAPIASTQAEYSLLERDDEPELTSACLAHGVGLIPWAPLAGGLLTGKYRENEPPPTGSRGQQISSGSGEFQARFEPRSFAIVRRLAEWAESRGRSVGDLAVAWLVAQPAVATIITGARNAEQIEANARAGEWHLSGDEAREVAELAPSRRRAFVHRGLRAPKAR